VHNGVADFQLILKVVFCELLDDFLDVFLEAIAAVISDLDELFGTTFTKYHSLLTNCLILLISTDPVSYPLGALELEV
jgi:hypothetical protein